MSHYPAGCSSDAAFVTLRRSLEANAAWQASRFDGHVFGWDLQGRHRCRNCDTLARKLRVGEQCSGDPMYLAPVRARVKKLEGI